MFVDVETGEGGVVTHLRSPTVELGKKTGSLSSCSFHSVSSFQVMFSGCFLPRLKPERPLSVKLVYSTTTIDHAPGAMMLLPLPMKVVMITTGNIHQALTTYQTWCKPIPFI